MSSHSKIDLIKAILHCRENAVCAVHNNDYNLIEWNDPRPKPSLKELEDAWQSIELKVLFDPIRIKRNALLSECDYTQLPDYTKSDKEDWVIYRNRLRNIPQSFGDPESVIWPTKPN